MSTFPSAAQGDFDLPPRQRVSILALSSLVTGLLCCIPGMGLVSLILGASGIIAISRAEGRLAGRGLAVAGLILGLIGSIYALAVGVVTYATQGELHRYGSTYALIQSQDVNGLKARLTPTTAALVTNETVAHFHDQVQADWGRFIATPKGISDWIRSYMEVSHALQGSPVQPSGTFTSNLMPVPVKFDKGTALIMFILDRSRSGGGALGAAIENMAILDRTGRPTWLVDPTLTPGAAPYIPAQPPAPVQTAPAQPAETPAQTPAGEDRQSGG
jgi:hypothetical protein